MHILFLIFKIICWILLVVLCLVVLAACLVLFTPLRYQVRAKCEGDVASLAAEADFSVFFHLVRASVRYVDQKLSWQLGIAWKKISSEPGASKEDEGEGKKKAEETENVMDKREDVPVKKEAETPIVPEAPAVTRGEEDARGRKQPLGQERLKPAKEDSKPKQSPKNTFAKEDSKPKESPQQTSAKEDSKPKEPLFAKISDLVEKLKCTFQEICGKMETLQKKKDVLVDFVTDEVHAGALKKVLFEVKKLLRRLLPKKLQANVRFGFEDPSVTGRVLAGVSVIYPSICEHLDIRPDFGQEVLEGSMFMKGQVRACIFAAMLCNLLLNANCRRTLLDIKNFSFDV